MDKAPFYLTKRKLSSGKSVYYFYYYVNGERTVPKTTGKTRKQDAISYCINYLNCPKPKSILFSDYAQNWFEDNHEWTKYRCQKKTLSKNTISVFKTLLKNKILPYFSHFLLSDIKTSDIRNFRTMLLEKENFSASSINVTMTVLKTMLDWAEETHIIEHSPYTKNIGIISLKKTKRAFYINEVIKLLDNTSSKIPKTIFIVCAVLGLRISEALALEKKHLFENYILIEQQFVKGNLSETKTKTSRFVMCPPILISFLKHIAGYTFVFEHDLQPYSYAKAGQWLRQYRNKAKLDKELSLHSLRHFFNTFLISNNINSEKINFMIGHSSGVGSMLSLYTTWEPKMYKDVLELQNNLISELKVVNFLSHTQC